MVNQVSFWNLFVLFIAILGGLLFVNLLLYLFDSPYRISILWSIILTAIIIALQLVIR
jgi:hypothetical protein